MAELYDILKPESTYYDRKNYDSQVSYNLALSTSSTVYVGNLSFFTTQDSIRELFSLAGKVVEIIMGIND
jgi:nuclear cap-binding protein subunit 2